MAVKITTVSEAVNDNGLKILVYGMSGAGKTVMCATANQPTIIISAEGGLLSLQAIIEERPELAKMIKVITVKTLDDLDEAYDYFKNSSERLCNWICIDSISDIAERILSEEKKINKDPRASYGNLADRVLDKLRDFRDIPLYNICTIAKMVRAEDEDGKSYYIPLFPGKGITNNIPYLFDEVFALRVEEFEDEDGEIIKKRIIQTGFDSKYFAKDRSGKLDDFEPANLSKIFKKIRGYDEVNFELDEESAEKYRKIKKINDTEEYEPPTYWHHIPSGKVIVAGPEDDTYDLDSDDDVEQISKERYDSIMEELATPDPKDGEEIEEEPDVESELEEEGEQEEEGEEDSSSDYEESFISDCVQYWKHIPSGGTMKTEEDTDISELLVDDDVQEIDEDEYDELNSESSDKKDQPVKKETKLEKAAREMKERNAAKK